MKTNTKTILLFIMSFALIGFISFTYAYFSSDIVNNNVKDQVVQTGTLSLRYVDGPEINMQNIKPGFSVTKTIYVANTGTLDTSYNLIWQELVNEITNDEMVIEATCTRMDATTETESGSCNSITSKPIKNKNIRKNITIEPSIVHKYDITITFKETNDPQNYNQGKKFSGVLGVSEFKLLSPVYCTFDGQLIKGAQYTNGQYSYIYQQRYYSPNYKSYGMVDLNADGWSVYLTDYDSTNSITDKVCTYINGKPVVSANGLYISSKATSIDLSSFNTSNITDMSSMFERSAATVLDLSSFDTSNVTDMNHMFSGSKVNKLDVSNFDTSKLTSTIHMFSNINISNLNLSNFDTSNVIDMSLMFDNIIVPNLDLSGFDTSNVTDMDSMFSGSKINELDLRSFNTSKVTNMSHMFDNANITKTDFTSFDTSNVTSMSYMFFNNAATTLDLSNFDTSNVTSMNYMFRESAATTLDLSSFDTSKVTDMYEMFYNCNNLKTIYVSDRFNTNSVTSSSNMFFNTTNLVGGAGTTYNSSYVDKTYARIDGGTS
ncbi:MAG: TasA family protein, partial [Bacilli bacterium]